MFDTKDLLMRAVHEGVFDNKTIKRFSGEYKRTYRLLMIQCWCSSFFNDRSKFYEAFQEIKRLYRALNTSTVGQINKQVLSQINQNCAIYLTDNCGMKIKDKDKTYEDDYLLESNIQQAADFLIKYKDNLMQNKPITLYRYSEISSFWDLSDQYKENKLLEHHWFDFRAFEMPQPIFTFPEYFAYADLINLWNDTIKKMNDTLTKGYNSKVAETRELRFSYFSSLRTVAILGVHFMETYLYYLYYNLRSLKKFPENTLLNRKDIRSINDKQIIEELLFIEFPSLQANIVPLYQKYQETLRDRDAFVHISAFTEDHSGASKMQRLVNIDINDVINDLDNIINMIELIEAGIGEDSILFWWDLFERPVFKRKTYISPLRK
ncbi:hypothetical protein [Paenibacillus sp. FSL H7-689]|uniref:hypothetical protein n=1 Tax=Paenibacillus sp. FSL H7-689 TaxID=1227349 RepID=UPI0003E1F5A6|nr:hypothetical protein [Paenibacillus sp. FSL H7-689]ETT56076.1 hypothetical protein C170_01274 [Paenibacillus sp. FSL H7-689]